MKDKEIENENAEPFYPRDENGDVIFPNVKINMRDINRWNTTLVFNEWDEEYKEYFPIAEIMTTASYNEQKEELDKKKIILYQLFESPKGMESNYVNYHCWLRSLAYEFFKEVFKYGDSMHSMLMDFDSARIIIKQETFDSINNFINEYKLEQIKDLVFYLIAKIGDFYVKEISYFELPDVVKQMNNAGKQVEKLIEIIERTNPYIYDYSRKEKPLPANEITFCFPDIPPLKIEDPWLIKTMVGAVKEHYEEGAYKNWRKELVRYGLSFNEDIDKKKYRFHVAKALHNFFSHLKVFPIKKESKTSNPQMLCISKILEFGLIKIGSEELSDAEKIKNVRNYIKPERNELFTYPSFLEEHPNKILLSKYFIDPYFQKIPDTKEIEDVVIAHYICERFDMLHLRVDMAHIIAYIKERNLQVGAQLSIQGVPTDEHPVIGTLFKLISPFNLDINNTRISNLTFQLDGKLEILSINEPLPLTLIQRALIEYYQNHQEEFDIDICTRNPLASPKVDDNSNADFGTFKAQHQRLLPVLCSSIYQFLLHEAPPSNLVHSAFELYSEIIAVILQRCMIFKHLRDEEYVIQKKVKQWLKEAKDTSK